MSLNLDKSSWKRVAFQEVIDSITDRVNDPARAGVDRYVGLEHLDPGIMTVQRWDRPDKVEAQKLRFRSGDVIFGRRRAYQKKVALAEFEGICSAHALVLRARPRLIDPSFLPVFLSSDYFLDRAIEISVGSLSPTVNWHDLKGQEFILPPLDEQKRIADLVWSVERHRQAVRLQAEGAKELTEQVFGTELATAPAERVALPQLLKEVTVGVVVRPTQYYTDDPAGVPALRGLNIVPGGFDLTDLVRFRAESASALKKSTLSTGDVAIVRTGRPGDAAVITENVAGFNCIDLIIARPGPELVADFLAAFLNSTYGRAQIARLSAGTAQQHFNVGALKKLELPHFSVEQQREIIRRVELVRATNSRSHQEAAELHRLKKAILHETLGGK